MTREWEDAVRRGAVDELERLAAGGADINAKDQHGHTALMVAALKGEDVVARWLIAHGATLDHTAKYGLSALMLAVVNGRRGIVQMLVEAGADRTLRGAGAPGFSGQTALDLAVAAGDDETVRVLRAADDLE